MFNMPEHNLPIECERLRLRDFRSSDLERFTDYRADPDIARYQGWEDFCKEDAMEFFEIQDSLRFGVAGTWYQIAIAESDTDLMVGDCVIHFTGDKSLVEIGFTLAPEAHGKGYAFEAISALVHLIFHSLRKLQIIAVTHAHNAVAHRLLGRLGFDSREHESTDPEPELLHRLSLEHWKQLQKTSA